jgi:membrane protease subunit (stomatin/prohibitin family)
VLIAPGSAEDEARIQALNAGERALTSAAGGAAQLHHDIRAAAALMQAEPPSPAPMAPAVRFCSECGAGLTPNARFCAACGAAVQP